MDRAPGPPQGDPERAWLLVTDPQAWATQTLTAIRREQRAAFWRRGVWTWLALAAVGSALGVAAAHVAWGGTALRMAMLSATVLCGAAAGIMAAVGWDMADDDPLPKGRMWLGAAIGTTAPLLLLFATGGLSLLLYGRN